MWRDCAYSIRKHYTRRPNRYPVLSSFPRKKAPAAEKSVAAAGRGKSR